MSETIKVTVWNPDAEDEEDGQTKELHVEYIDGVLEFIVQGYAEQSYAAGGEHWDEAEFLVRIGDAEPKCWSVTVDFSPHFYAAEIKPKRAP